MLAFIFYCRSFSPCWPLAFLIFSPPLWISMFFFPRNSSPLFSITRSSSFSVIHVSVNIKNNAEKDTTLLLFFLSKSPGGHVISFQIKPWVAFGLPYLLIELFYIGMPVVRTDGRSLDRSVYGHVITKFSGMGRLPHFLSYGALLKIYIYLLSIDAYYLIECSFKSPLAYDEQFNSCRTISIFRVFKVRFVWGWISVKRLANMWLWDWSRGY